MIWANSIADLQYYNQPPPPAPCYCEHLVYPSDLVLQASFSPSFGTLDFDVELLTPDGLTQLELPATTKNYFQWYFFIYNGVYYANIRLKTYSPVMCTKPCWILKVTITNKTTGQVIFDKYTQRYCQTTCCDVPRGITFEPADIENPSEALTVSTSVPLSNCNKPLIRIEVEFPCLDNQLGDFYGIPTSVISGTASFNFKKITNIPGKIRQRPREITREISYNCNLQRAESFKPYILESISDQGIFPTWKLNELEGMFHAPEIMVTDFFTQNTYQFAGGIIAEQVYKCWEIFKLKTTLQTCTVRQVFGCNESCEPISAMAFLMPQNSTGTYYDENNQAIGDYEDLLNWYRGQNGITEVTDTSGEYDNTAGSFTVEGTGYIPTFFYYNGISPRNRVYGTFTPVAPVIACAMPVLGTPIVEDDICITPVLGTPIVTDEAEDTADVYSYGNWVVSEDSEVILSEGYGRLYISTIRTYDTVTQQITADVDGETITVPEGDCVTIIYGSETYQRTVDFTQSGDVVTMTNGVTFTAGDEVGVVMNVGAETNPNLISEIIGVIANNGWPSSPVQIITTDYTLQIDLLGQIYYTGYPNSTTVGGAAIDISNLYYTL